MMLARSDFVPFQRAEHFRWIADEAGQTIVGWNIRILEVRETNTGIRIKAKVTAELADLGFSVGAHTLESYLLSNGRLNFLGLETSKAPRIATYN